MKRQTGIDIVVPVYNALEDLKLCVQSVKKHTDLSLDRLVLIDDRSPDANVFPYMQSLEQPGIVVLQNEENQGFSGTVNRGMTYSNRDVILLNSDTVVTEGWVDKILACAYSDDAIGTVTPFSNNATLCSIPNFLQDNQIPYGLSIDEYAAIVERCSMRQYPRITVAVGFCMFIKREVIRCVGLFDKETFQKGYGEENDFCWRAEQYGYHHVLCDDTYIYHSGSCSFLSEEKTELMREHEAIIQERYPVQNQRNGEYVRDNPDGYLRANVDIHAKLRNGKRNILYVLHMDFRADAADNIGGTQFHVKDLTEHMRRENNVFVLARDGQMLRVTAYLETQQITFSFPVGKKPDFQCFHNEALAQAYRQVLAAFAIDFVHVHHISGLSLDIFTVAKEMGIPMAASIHDFYYVCPSILLMEKGCRYCAGFGRDCVDCLNQRAGYTRQVDILPVWRQRCREALEMCDVLIAPSQAVKDIFSGVYPQLGQKIRVVYHGMDAFEEAYHGFQPEQTKGLTYSIEHAFEKDHLISGWACCQDRESRTYEVFVCLQDKEGNFCSYRAMPVSRPDVAQSRANDKYLYSGFRVQIPDGFFASGELKLQLILRCDGEEYCSKVTVRKGYTRREKSRRRIAFLGGLNETKGSANAFQMIKESGSRYDWYIIGGIGDPNLLTLEKNNVFKTDWYKRENVCHILRQNRIDLVCILTICPETFCYTLSEAQLAGVPVIATDIGALGERLRRDGTGWLVEHDADARTILQKMDEIFGDEDACAQVGSRLAAFRHKSIEDMCREYEQLYVPFQKRDKRHDFDAKAVFSAYAMGQAEAAGTAGFSDGMLIRRVNELEATLNTINQSLEYRMVKFFNREKIPGKRFIKWCIGFAYRVYLKFFRR